MPAQRRRYTKREKATVVIAAEMATVAAAAQAHGIPETTVRYWMDDPRFVDLRSKTREEASQGFSVLMHLAQERLVGLIPGMEPRDLIVLLGVSTDKSQLLSGHATDRTEHRDLTDRLDDHERAVLGDAIRGELARRADATVAEPAVERPEPAGATST